MLSPEVISFLSDMKVDGALVAVGFLTAVILIGCLLLLRRATGDSETDAGDSSDLLTRHGESETRSILAADGMSDDEIDDYIDAGYEHLGLDPNDPDSYR
jgi:hypothetical protein